MAPPCSISWCVFLLSGELTEVDLFTVRPAAAMYVALIVLIFSMLSNCGVANNYEGGRREREVWACLAASE